MSDFNADGPVVTHIPGAGTDFARVGLVRIIDSDQVGPSLPRTALPSIRLAAPERLHPVAVPDAAVGDLLVTLEVFSDRACLGRPMQVVHRDDEHGAVALDDRDLPHSVNVALSFSSALGYGEPAAAWHVLAAFGVGRCPRCHSPGQQLIYGMPMGPPSAGAVLGGCFVPWLRTDLTCPRYHAEWPLPVSPAVYDDDYEAEVEEDEELQG